MLGMASRKVWVIAREMINTARTMGEVYARRTEEKETSKTETRLTWMPGMRPVKTPVRMPSMRAAKSAKISIFRRCRQIPLFINYCDEVDTWIIVGKIRVGVLLQLF